MNEILKLVPIFRETLWGGSWLEDEFGYQTSSSHTGECWAISAHREGDCRIAQGPFKGQTLSHVFATQKDLFAQDERTKFPLLIKLIDAHQDLSVQVHPDDTYAQAHENQYGKTEAWIVLHAEKDSRIELGHQAKTKAELATLIEKKEWNKLLSYRSIKKDQAFLVPAGTVHALCQGTAVLEIQQSSDVTYRFYDYDRVDATGKPRELHLQKAMDVVKVPADPIQVSPIDWTKTIHNPMQILDSRYFKVSALTIDGNYSWENRQGSYALCSVLAGQGKVGRHHLKKGDHFIITSQCQKANFKGNLQLVMVDPMVASASPKEKYSVGIDIGATYVRLGILSKDGILMKSIKESVTDQRTTHGLVDQLVSIYNRLPLKDYSITGVGVGIPGPVKPGSGYVYVFPNLQIEAFDVAQALEKRLHLPVKVTNDANAAAFGEALLGAGRGYRAVQFVTISTGIGGGLVLDGKLVTGRHGFAQEVGNMMLTPTGPRPNPSMNPGCWEAYCSGTSLVRQAKEMGISITHAGEVFSNKSLTGLVDTWLDYMAIALANMVTLYEPDVFVLGGGVMKSQALFLDKLQKKINQYLLPGLKGKVLIVPAKLDQDAGLIGAGLLPFCLK